MGFTRQAIRKDFAMATGQVPKSQKIIKFYMVNPGFRATVLYRYQQLFTRKHLLRTATLFSQLNHFISGAEFVVGCEIDPGLVVRHPIGIVLGQGVRIGANCILQHGVTLGVKNVGHNPSNDYPKIGSDVVIASYAVIVGKVTVGNNSVIGAHSFVNSDVPPFSMVAGQPARVVKHLNR